MKLMLTNIIVEMIESIYCTIIKSDAAMKTAVVNDNCPDAKGRCGLFICMHKTCNIVSN